MAKFAITHFVLVSFIANGLTLTINDFMRIGYPQLEKREEPRVVEIVRWRQSACLVPAPGVSPCSEASDSNNPKDLSQGDGVDDDLDKFTRQNKDHLTQKDEVTDDLFKKLTQDDSALDISSPESIEKDDSLDKKSSRTVSALKLYSPNVVKYVQLENMGSSTLQAPEMEPSREKRYLRFGSQMDRTGTRRQTVYTTKIIDSPVIATLVASICVPDIGVPLCDDLMEPESNPKNRKAAKPIDPTVSKPTLPDIISLAADSNSNEQVQGLNTLQLPAVFQSINDYLNRPNVVQTNEDPSIKPVIVVQPTSSPGLLSGINAWLMPGGSYWFNIFNRPNANNPQATDNTQGFPGGIGFLPGFIQLPQIPSLQEIFYRPENDISDQLSILNVLGLPNTQNNRPGAGPPTERPGIFGGLFASPTRPEGIDDTTPSSLLGGITNLFRPTNRPLVIERPNEKPVVVEKPIYVVEQPATPGFLDIFQNPNRPANLNPNEKPVVITNPVYVLQKPTERPSLFGTGLLPNWNIFNVSSNNPANSPATAETPPTSTGQHSDPTPIVFIDTPTLPHEPVVIEIEPQLPIFPNPPEVTPATLNINSAGATAAAGSSSSGSSGHSQATAFAASGTAVNDSHGTLASLALTLATAENSGKDSSKSGISSQKSSDNLGTDVEGNPLATRNSNAEGNAPLTSDSESSSLRNIDGVETKEQVNNEA